MEEKTYSAEKTDDKLGDPEKTQISWYREIKRALDVDVIDSPAMDAIENSLKSMAITGWVSFQPQMWIFRIGLRAVIRFKIFEFMPRILEIINDKAYNSHTAHLGKSQSAEIAYAHLKTIQSGLHFDTPESAEEYIKDFLTNLNIEQTTLIEQYEAMAIRSWCFSHRNYNKEERAVEEIVRTLYDSHSPSLQEGMARLGFKRISEYHLGKMCEMALFPSEKRCQIIFESLFNAIIYYSEIYSERSMLNYEKNIAVNNAFTDIFSAKIKESYKNKMNLSFILEGLEKDSLKECIVSEVEDCEMKTFALSVLEEQ
jgi:hypothetical protein